MSTQTVSALTEAHTQAQDRLDAAREALDNGGRGYVHTVLKADIMRGLVEGIEVPTLCRVMMPIGTRDGDVDAGGLPPCPACQVIRTLARA